MVALVFGDLPNNPRDISVERVAVLRERLGDLGERTFPPPARFAWCKARFTEEIDRLASEAAERAAERVDLEARYTLGHIAKLFVAEFERSGERGRPIVCPSARAVPAKLDPAGARYQSTAADWQDPGWRCLRFSLTQPQEFQYAVTVNGNVVSATARRGGSRPIEYTLRGAVDPVSGRLQFEPKPTAR